MEKWTVSGILCSVLPRQCYPRSTNRPHNNLSVPSIFIFYVYDAWPSVNRSRCLDYRLILLVRADITE